MTKPEMNRIMLEELRKEIKKAERKINRQTKSQSRFMDAMGGDPGKVKRLTNKELRGIL